MSKFFLLLSILTLAACDSPDQILFRDSGIRVFYRETCWKSSSGDAWLDVKVLDTEKWSSYAADIVEAYDDKRIVDKGAYVTVDKREISFQSEDLGNWIEEYAFIGQNLKFTLTKISQNKALPPSFVVGRERIMEKTTCSGLK